MSLIFLLGGLGLAVAAALFLFRHRTEAPHSTIETIGDRLRAHTRDRSDYRLFVGIPPALPVDWTEVERIKGDCVSLKDHPAISLSEVTAYFVAYPGGQLADCRCPDHLPVPQWVRFPENANLPDHDILTLANLKAGTFYASVTFGPSTSRPGSPHHYSTTVTNISRKRIRVVKFGGYQPDGDGFRLKTITSKFFTAEDFRDWYDQKVEWLEPGASVTDPNNYGSPPALWAYYCESEDGESFIAGGIVR